MLFNSYVFILFFLPITLLVYYGLNRIGKERAAKWFLIAMSLWFYAYFHKSYFWLLSGSIVFNFICSRVILRQAHNSLKRKGALTVGILANIGVIFYFKYFDFFLENVNLLFGSKFTLLNILMPLGISFFTFQQISYLVDSYRGETKAYRFEDYALFVTFFPQLVAGPIVLHEEMIPQFHDKTRKKMNHDKISCGIWLFAVGLFKKVMIADVLGKGVDWGFSNASLLVGMEVAIVALLYTLQLYFDFSGYCDMACGIANMFQFDLPQNFDSPYKATSIPEFWQRWHMSLNRFLRKYIYIPLGGSRKGTLRTVFNVMIVFLISGIWHGAEWTFILWGVLHGFANVLCRLCKKTWETIPRLLRWLGTFVFVNLTWVIFRAESVNQAGVMFRNLIKPWKWELNSELLSKFDLLEFTYIEDHVAGLGALITQYPGLHLAIILTIAVYIALVPQNCYQKKFTPSIKNAVGSVVMLIWSIVSLSGLSTFLYFNF